MAWIKKELKYLIDSFSQILNGLVLTILASSGLFVAIMLRTLSFNGTIITFVSIVVEIVSLVLVYLYLRRFFTIKDKDQEQKRITKK